MKHVIRCLRTFYPVFFLCIHSLLAAEEPEAVHPITISGVARNAAGEPIAGADVYVNSVLSSAYRRVAQTKTDASGKYLFENVKLPLEKRRNSNGSNGKFEVFGIAEGYGLSWRTSKYFFPERNVLWDQPGPDPPRSYGPEDDIVLDLTFPVEAKLRGRIVGEEGQPVPGVRLDMRFCERIHDDIARGILGASHLMELISTNDSPENVLVPQDFKIQHTAGDGTFTFSQLPPECFFRIYVRGEGFGRRDLWAATTNTELPKLSGRTTIQTGDIELTLHKTYELKVHVTQELTGSPGKAAFVSARSAEYYYWQTTDEQGNATLQVPLGTYKFHLLPAIGTNFLSTEVDSPFELTSAPQTEPHNLNLHAACQLDVTIVNAEDGQPLEGKSLWISTSDDPNNVDQIQRQELTFRSWNPPTSMVHREKSDAQGKLRVVVPPGVHRIGIRETGDMTGQIVIAPRGRVEQVEFRVQP